MNIYEENLNANYHNYTFGPYLATDDLGRALPTSEETGPQRKNRHVGMFYFLWNGVHVGDKRPLDISKIIAAFPKAGYYPDMDIWGAYSVMHHWGEPLFGYYYTEDEWVMRKHIEMLTIADIDFLVFDTTNAVIYERNAKLMMRLLNEYRQAGWNTPKVVFYTNTRSGYTAQLIYDAIYKADYMPDTWFYLDGKPLIIAKEDDCSEDVRNFFTIRASQWPNEPTKLNGWPWMDFERPQRVLKNHRGEEEIINVSVAQHPQIRFGDSALYGEESNRGRSYHNGANDKSEGAYKYGYNFAEQWERALETDPPYVFVTGWNEWIAGNWDSDRGWSKDNQLGKYTDDPRDMCMFVDNFNIDHSRDIEPMTGGYGDNYYMQMCNFIRQYKGTNGRVNVGKKTTVDINGDWSQWDDATAVYKDFINDTSIRDVSLYDKWKNIDISEYENNTGRNDISVMKVARDDKHFYFYVDTVEDISDPTDNWMTLFLATGFSKTKKWNGYDFVVNRTAPPSKNKAVLEKYAGDNKWKKVAEVDMRVEGNKLMLKVPASKIGISSMDIVNLQFKWADNCNMDNGIWTFYQDGDAAPYGRFNFLFSNKA